MLISRTSGKRYIGQTQDLAARVAQHNDPETNRHKYTSKLPGPWDLVHHEAYATRSEAMRREKQLKSGQGRAWLDAKLNRQSPPEAD